MSTPPADDRSLPTDINLEQQRKRAKQLVKAFAAGDSAATP